ncbi:MAG: amino acid permease [Verrucomicrobiota bacterium]
MIVAGSMIGSGILYRVRDIGRQLGSAGWLLTAWLITGLLTLMAALSYGELAAMMPRAGAWPTYLRESYGPLCGFLYGGLCSSLFRSARLPRWRWLCAVPRCLDPGIVGTPVFARLRPAGCDTNAVGCDRRSRPPHLVELDRLEGRQNGSGIYLHSQRSPPWLGWLCWG